MEQSIPRLKIHLLKSTNKVLCCLKTHKKKAARRQAKKKNSCKKEVLDSEYLLQVSGILDSLLKWICDNVYQIPLSFLPVSEVKIFFKRLIYLNFSYSQVVFCLKQKYIKTFQSAIRTGASFGNKHYVETIQQQEQSKKTAHRVENKTRLSYELLLLPLPVENSYILLCLACLSHVVTVVYRMGNAPVRLSKMYRRGLKLSMPHNLCCRYNNKRVRWDRKDNKQLQQHHNC